MAFKHRPSRDNQIIERAGDIPAFAQNGECHVQNAPGWLDDSDRATLRHLVDKGTAANTRRAYERDLAYLQAWALAATGERLPWPAPRALLLKFIAHHLFDPEKRKEDGRHGMPQTVEDALISARLKAAPGPSRPATVQRRLAVWSGLHKSQGLPSPTQDAQVRTILRKAVAASAVLPGRKSERAITLPILRRMLATCDSSGWGLRDRALLCFMFASGGRRRSEASALSFAQLHREETPVEGGARLSFRIALGRTKTRTAQEGKHVWLTGSAAQEFDRWLSLLHRTGLLPRGPVFRPLTRDGRIGHEALSHDAIADIVKRRIRLAGLDPRKYSAHGLRAGYLTEAANQGVPLPQAMMQSDHRDVKQAARYYNEADIARSLAAALMDKL